jgi:hypothetical protein
MMLLENLYEQQIRPLPIAHRLQLISRIAEDLVSDELAGKRRITELCGLGKEVWQNIDAQKYVESLRSEWERRL